MSMRIHCFRFGRVIPILRSFRHCLHQQPRLQSVAGGLELSWNLRGNADWHRLGSFVSTSSKLSPVGANLLGFHNSWYKNRLRLLEQHEERTGEAGGSEPEYRLPPAILGAPLIFIGLLWFGWTSYASIHWIVPIIGSAFFGCGWVQ